jgi:mannosyltransferase
VPGEPAQRGGPSNVATRAPAPGTQGVSADRLSLGDHAARWTRPAVVAVLVIAVVLRFLASSPLWLDEAQTVVIAQKSLPHLFSALREDGAPPLYYVFLHYWMAVFGTSTFAVRVPSGIFSVAALPLMFVAARRFRVLDSSPWPAVLLLATCPFVVRYATEARMYSLVLLLVLIAVIAYERVWSVGGWWPSVGAALVTGALVLTQYWSLFLVATAFLAAAVAAWRGVSPAKRMLAPMVIGCLAFVPWLPSFAYQSAHTGAPWGPPPGFDIPVVSLGTWVGGGVGAPLLRWAYYILVALALAGYPAFQGGLRFGRPLRKPQLVLLGLAIGSLLLGTVASEIASSAFSPRYTTIAIPPLLLVVAAGFGAVPARYRTAGVAVVCALGLGGAALLPGQLRTQAGQVATVLAAAGPHDLVIFCPDQLGPAVHRIAPDAGTQVVYPTFGSPAMVDWVNYKQRNEQADPVAFARTALQRANGHAIWLVSAIGYPTLGGGCSSLLTSLTLARGRPIQLLSGHGALEKDTVAEFPAR